MNSLKSNWIRRVNNKCYEALKNIKSGWFNISSSNFKIYQSSINKLRKLITVIQYMMEVWNFTYFVICIYLARLGIRIPLGSITIFYSIILFL